MEHVVFFPAPDGSPAFRRVADRDEAVRLVEHLRNVDGVVEVSVHALKEVPLAFTTWYRVEVPAAAPEAAPIVEVADVFEASIPLQAPVLAASNGRTVESATSLGFFAS